MKSMGHFHLITCGTFSLNYDNHHHEDIKRGRYGSDTVSSSKTLQLSMRIVYSASGCRVEEKQHLMLSCYINIMRK